MPVSNITFNNGSPVMYNIVSDVGPYMLGVIKQNTGSTDGGYFVLGGMLFLAGLIMLTLPKKTAIDRAKEQEE